MDKLKIFVGNSHQELGSLICSHLNMAPSPCTLRKFSNGETSVQLNISVRNQDVYIIQSGDKSINDSIMELLILISACKGGSAARITVIIPEFPYAKHSKMTKSRSAITARMLADLITMAGADHVVSMDLKASQMQGFFDKPIDNLYAAPTLAHWIRFNIPNYETLAIVSKDSEGTKRVAELADKLKVNFAMVHTDQYFKDGVSTEEHQRKITTLVGNVKDKPIMILDDTIDKPDLIITAANFCKSKGQAKNVYVAATHGVFLDDCLEKLNDCEFIDKIIVTNTHAIPEEKMLRNPKLEVIDVSRIFAECIRRLHNGESISQLFNANNGIKYAL
ncbi:hypothetical protein DASC09_019380 [Saccharomycopsis crataegensis]|uniref:Ribose-phosphate pyrophosphokinase 1 n=1 Tax=Saccharomycopsis crataegensis TaxID=43959 RepID=A0AAV5QIL3_9ASCO|nr:hypothetical protein DASC09_019380 [Saccharomycopsis crataegensis]